MAMGNAVSFPNAETSCCPDCYAPAIRTSLLAAWHSRLHQVAGLETKHALGGFGRCSGKTVLVHPTHLARAPAHRLDEQGLVIGAQLDRLTRLTHTSRVDPMGFGIGLAYPIELR